MNYDRITLSDDTRDAVLKTELPRNELYVKDLKTSLSVSSRRNNWFKDIKYLTFLRNGGCCSEDNVCKILTYCRQLIELKFESGTCALKELKNGLSGLELNFLKSLTVSAVS